MSIRKIFEEELADLKTQLVEMCRLTEQMISDAITALVNRDRELGKSIRVMDKRVDEYEMAIEKKCMRILLKQQPVAKDFREVSTALKMITDIERFGDQAADIGDLVYTMPGDAYIKKLTHINAMGNLAVKMVRESVNSFINNDEALADEIHYAIWRIFTGGIASSSDFMGRKGLSLFRGPMKVYSLQTPNSPTLSKETPRADKKKSLAKTSSQCFNC